MELSTALIALAGFFVAAFLKGITGLGFSTVCLGLVAGFIDMRVALPLVLVPSLASNVLVMLDAGRFREAVARFWPVFAAAVPGVAIGLWVLDSVDSVTLRRALGTVLALYGAWALCNMSLRLGERAARRLAIPVGFVNGVVNGVTGTQVMPVLPYLLALGLPSALFVQSINIVFTLSSFVMLAGLGRLGLLNAPLLLTGAAGVVPVALGIWLGGKLRRRLPQSAFKRMVLVLLVVLGAGLALGG